MRFNVNVWFGAEGEARVSESFATLGEAQRCALAYRHDRHASAVVFDNGIALESSLPREGFEEIVFERTGMAWDAIPIEPDDNVLLESTIVARHGINYVVYLGREDVDWSPSFLRRIFVELEGAS